MFKNNIVLAGEGGWGLTHQLGKEGPLVKKQKTGSGGKKGP